MITTHTYGITNGFLDADGKTGKILSPNPKAVTQSVVSAHKKISDFSKPGLELNYTERSTSPSPFDNVHDSYQSTPFILDKIKGTEKIANSMSYWTFTDIFEEAGPRATPFYGGFGLLNYQSIKKPAYFAYQFLNQLGETEIINKDSASWVCKDSKGGVEVLLWNFKVLHKGDSVNNDVFYKRDLPAKGVGKVKVNLANVPEGKYPMELYKTGYRVNDAYATYYDLGSPNQLTKQQETLLKSKNSGAAIEKIMVNVGKNRTFNKELEMRENDVYFIRLIKL